MTITESRTMTEDESHQALARARADHAAAQSEVDTLATLIESGRVLALFDHAAAKVSDEITALRLAVVEREHTEASERANHARRTAWADNVRPQMESLDTAASQAADRFTFAARELVGAIKAREDAVDRLHSEAQGVGASDRVLINQYSGVSVDQYALTHYKSRILTEIAPAFSALLSSAGEPGAAENFRTTHKGRGLPRVDKDSK